MILRPVQGAMPIDDGTSRTSVSDQAARLDAAARSARGPERRLFEVVEAGCCLQFTSQAGSWTRRSISVPGARVNSGLFGWRRSWATGRPAWPAAFVCRRSARGLGSARLNGLVPPGVDAVLETGVAAVFVAAEERGGADADCHLLPGRQPFPLRRRACGSATQIDRDALRLLRTAARGDVVHRDVAARLLRSDVGRERRNAWERRGHPRQRSRRRS